MKACRWVPGQLNMNMGQDSPVRNGKWGQDSFIREIARGQDILGLEHAG
jgi:hypothetical protein